LTPAFQNRNSDAPLIRFLPKGEARAIQSRSSRSVRAWSTEEFTALSDAAGRLHTTLPCLLLAGFSCWLSRLTHQEALVVSIDCNEYALLNLGGECSFRELLQQTESSRVPSANLDGDNTGQGVYFYFQPEPGLLANPQAGIRLVARQDGLELELTSLTGNWDESTLWAWLGFLLTLLQAASQNPSLPIRQLPLWDESEARQFYENLNRTEMEFPGEPLVVGRFQEQAARRPDTTAVVSGFRRYNYRELDRRSSELSRLLVAYGAGPGRAVAICMDRSVDLPMSILAVLKSGAFYVPLDSRNPADRLRGILEECNPVSILSDAAVIAGVQKIVDPDSIPIICVDQPWPTGTPVETTPIETQIGAQNPFQPSDLAYTIYTSGTTGKPKGVAITHAALLNLICSIWRIPGIGESDHTLAVAPISFDIATMDMLLPICSGGTLVLASRRDSVDPYRLAQLMEDHSITFMQATPVTWRMLISSGWKGKRNLKMISGGEALPRELANTLCRLGGELWNCYGPTETAIYSGVIRIVLDSDLVPVGPPIANTSFYVMDSAGFPVPPGVPGELYIGGIGVSPGYVGLPELTAEKFVPDHWGHVPVASSPSATGTLFRTGDLVRILKENQFEFFGRLDHQVKLRGFRIELEEIESVLRTHPAVRDAVVVLREDLPGEPRLVAYVTSPNLPVAGADVREFAARTLPEYMIPTVIVALEQFPLSTSGKIDRRSLPLPESVPGQNVADHPEATAAADELEAKLLKIFRDVLRHNSIGVTDSFFHYGGYSLLTMRLFSRIDRELNVRLPISLLFDAPSVRDLARVIRKGIAPSVIVPIRPYGNSAPMFVIQSYLLYNAMLEIVESDRPVYGVREMGDEREPISVEDRARRFVHEILNVSPFGPVYLAGWCAAGTLTVEIARQLRESGHDVGLVALFDAEHPGFTLPSGPRFLAARLWKKAVFHTGRLERIPWGKKFTYILEALERNWEWVVESYYTKHYRTMLWLHKRFGLSLSEAAFNNVYASLASLKDFSDRPYPGKLNLFRASDVPDLSEVDTTLGWSSIAQGGVVVNFVPGDHVSMFKKPHVDSLAHRLQQEIRKSELNLIRTA
jgi:amino acid adenylation domain-containing protein